MGGLIERKPTWEIDWMMMAVAASTAFLGPLLALYTDGPTREVSPTFLFALSGFVCGFYAATKVKRIERL